MEKWSYDLAIDSQSHMMDHNTSKGCGNQTLSGTRDVGPVPQSLVAKQLPLRQWITEDSDNIIYNLCKFIYII